MQYHGVHQGGSDFPSLGLVGLHQFYIQVLLRAARQTAADLPSPQDHDLLHLPARSSQHLQYGRQVLFLPQQIGHVPRLVNCIPLGYEIHLVSSDGDHLMGDVAVGLRDLRQRAAQDRRRAVQHDADQLQPAALEFLDVQGRTLPQQTLHFLSGHLFGMDHLINAELLGNHHSFAAGEIDIAQPGYDRPGAQRLRHLAGNQVDFIDPGERQEDVGSLNLGLPQRHR